MKSTSQPLCRRFVISALLTGTFWLTVLPITGAWALELGVRWDPPTTNTDGTELIDLAGFKVYRGVAPEVYDVAVDVGNVTEHVFDDMAEAVVYFIAVTAYDRDGNESPHSEEVSWSQTAPVANADAYTVDEDETLTVGTAAGVLANDADAEDEALAVELVDGVAHGTLDLDVNGALVYVPAADFAGSDSFTYRVSDGTLVSGAATVTLTVRAVNDAPVAVADAYSVDENHTLTVATPGILANDTDLEEDSLSAVLVTDVSEGTLSLEGDGSFTYRPPLFYSGEQSFTYKLSDGTAESLAATVTITVVDVIDRTPPAAPRGLRFMVQ